MIEAKSSGLSEMLASGDPTQVAEACNDVVENWQAEFALPDDVAAAVKRLGSPGKKAAKLAGAIRRSAARLVDGQGSVQLVPNTSLLFI